jgi:hypothetical protein
MQIAGINVRALSAPEFCRDRFQVVAPKQHLNPFAAMTKDSVAKNAPRIIRDNINGRSSQERTI